MSRLTQRGAVGVLSLFQTLSEAVSPNPYSASFSLVGERFDASDGREFVLVLNGTTALAAGNLVQGSPVIANHQNVAVTAYSAASTNTGASATVTVTLGNTAATINQYAGGYAVVNAGTGIGQTLKIASNPAANASASLVVTLEDAPLTALDATSKICLIPNLYNGVVVNPTTATNTPLGVTLYAITGSTASTTNVFGLIQSKGPVSCLSNGAIGVGLGVKPSTVVAGAVSVTDATGAQVGRALQAGVDTESRAIYVDL